jgi:hypothetical protein
MRDHFTGVTLAELRASLADYEATGHSPTPEVRAKVKEAERLALLAEAERFRNKKGGYKR